nr:flippase [Ardenticatena sp.]
MNTPANDARRVARNSFAQLANFLAVSVSKFLIIVAIARFRGVEDVGAFSFVLTFVMTFGVLNHMGLLLLLVRDIGYQRDNIHTYVGNALTMTLGLGLLSMVVMPTLVWLLGYPPMIVQAVALAAIAMAIDTWGNLLNAGFGGHERMDLSAYAIILQETAFFIAAAVVLLMHLPFLTIFVVYIISRLVGLGSSTLLYRRHWEQWPRPHLNVPLQRRLGRKTLPYALSMAMSPIFARVDILMLSYLRNTAEVGLYEVASVLFYRLNVLARMFSMAMLPLVARQYGHIGRGVAKYVRPTLKLQAAFALPLSVGGWLLSAPLIGFIFGEKYMVAAAAFQLMALITLLRFWDTSLGLTLTALDKQGVRSTIMVLGTLVNVGLNLALIPRLGYMGAAYSSVFSEIAIFVGFWWAIRRELDTPIPWRSLGRLLAAASVMGMVIWFIRDTLPLPLLITVGVLVYTLAIIGLRALTPQEMAQLLRILRIRRLPRPLHRLLRLPSPSLADAWAFDRVKGETE